MICFSICRMSGPTDASLRVIGALDGLDDALAHRLLVQLVVLLEPLLYRQLDGEVALQLLLEAGTSHCSSTLIGGMKPSMTSFTTSRRIVLMVSETSSPHHQVVALLVDDLALIVGDVVVLEQLLADIEVAALDLALGVLDGLGDPCGARWPRLLACRASASCSTRSRRRCASGCLRGTGRSALEPGSPWRPERPRSWLSMRRDSWRSVPMMCRPPASMTPGGASSSPRISPARRSSLVLGLRQLRLEVAAEHDVGTAAGHVGGDGHHAGLAGLGDDAGLALVLLGVQHLVRDLVFRASARDQLGGLDGRGAHQRRLAALDAVLDVLDDGVELLLAGSGRRGRSVVADHRLVGRDDHDLETVDLLELEGLGVGRAGHAGELVVEAEIGSGR
jgi:hypothetical protein